MLKNILISLIFNKIYARNFDIDYIRKGEFSVDGPARILPAPTYTGRDARFLFAGLQYLYTGPRKSGRCRPKELDKTVDIRDLPHPPLLVPDRVPLSGRETEYRP